MFNESNLDYGIIGNCNSAALIDKKASIDWCCLPRFDSPSVFAKILDSKIGGAFEIITEIDFDITQSYLGDSCILLTKFKNSKEEFEVIDFMPRFQDEKGFYHCFS